MLVKSRALAVAMATAGVIGFGAPVANAAVSAGPGDNGGLINVSHNQVPVQVCSNDVGVGVAGAGVPVDGAAITGALLGVSGNASSKENRSCTSATGQVNNAYTRSSVGDNGGLINVSHNQVPIEGCGNNAAVGVLGGGVTADGVAGSLGALLGKSGNSTSNENRSCHEATGQAG